MKKLIILIVMLILNTNIIFAGYGSNAGYSTTKKINIENQQWVLIAYTGGREVNISSNTVSAQYSILGSSAYDGNISYPANWNYNESSGISDDNDTMRVNDGVEDNATFNIEVQSSYWSQLLAHKNFSLNNIGEVAVEFTQDSSFMNLTASSDNDINSSYLMEIKLDGTDSSTDTILKLNYNDNYLGKIFTLYLDANESNNTAYTMTVIDGTSYILNDTTTLSTRPKTCELFEFNTTIGDGVTDNNNTYGASQIVPNLAISSNAYYTVAKFNAKGQSWMLYEANLTGDGVIMDGGLQDSNGSVNRVEKGSAYWYRMNLDSSADVNMSITIKDEDVEIDDISLEDDSWNLVALPKGHIKHSQGGLIILGTSDGDTLNFTGTIGDTEDASTNSIILKGASTLGHAKTINSFIDGKDGNGTLFEVPIRAYPINSKSSIFLVADTKIDFEINGATSIYSIGGDLYSSTSGKTKFGESAIAIHISDFINRVGVGTFTIEIPELYNSFSGVEVNLSNVSQDGLSSTYGTALANLRNNIESAMYNQACLHTKGDYNINQFDSDFDGEDDSFLIALKARYERNTTADLSNPTACSDKDVIRDDYNDKYLRIGVRENTYITPYLAKLDNNFSIAHIIDTSGNIYAKGSLSTDTTTVTINNLNYLGSSINSDRQNLFDNYIEWNLTKESDINSEGNYIYFVSNSRTLKLAESNVSEHNLSGASKYSILSQKDKNDVLMDVHYLTPTERKAQIWANGYDLNSTLVKGIITNVFTLADLAQAPLVSGGNLANAVEGIAGYSSTNNLNINTIWSVDMPKSGPLYDIVSKMGKPPKRILTFRNGKYLSLNLENTLDTSEWFNSENLYFISAFNGYWIRTDSNMDSYTINNTITSIDSEEFVLKTSYDMSSGTTSNYIFNKWLIKNVGSSSGFSTSMHNISIADINMSAKFTSANSGGDRYEVLIDPFTFSDFNESGFNGISKSITIANGFESSILASPITYSYTKPTPPTVIGTNNNVLTVNGLDGTLEVHLCYVDEVNLSFTRIASSTNSFFKMKPQDINVSSQSISNSYTLIGSDINETKIKFFNIKNNGLSSDVTTVIYPLFNVALINPETSGGDYNMSKATVNDLNQTEWFDADGDGSKEAQVIYNIISDDGTDGHSTSTPSRYDINGTKITLSGTHTYFSDTNATDGIQILSSQSGKDAVLSYRPNGVTTNIIYTADSYNMDIYDGLEGKYIADIDFRNNAKHYKYSGTKWYLYSEDTNKIYVGIFEVNATGGDQFVDCSDSATNCNTLTTTRTLSE